MWEKEDFWESFSLSAQIKLPVSLSPSFLVWEPSLPFFSGSQRKKWLKWARQRKRVDNGKTAMCHLDTRWLLKHSPITVKRKSGQCHLWQRFSQLFGKVSLDFLALRTYKSSRKSDGKTFFHTVNMRLFWGTEKLSPLSIGLLFYSNSPLHKERTRQLKMPASVSSSIKKAS